MVTTRGLSKSHTPSRFQLANENGCWWQATKKHRMVVWENLQRVRQPVHSLRKQRILKCREWHQDQGPVQPAPVAICKQFPVCSQRCVIYEFAVTNYRVPCTVKLFN